MLILVAVTVNLANENGGLFVKTREAKKDTAYKAEEENLLLYKYGESYNYEDGTVDLMSLKKELEKDDRWSAFSFDDDNNPTVLTVTGVQSGLEHKIYKMGEKKEDNQEIAGTYVSFFDHEFEITKDGKVIYDEAGSYVPYTYNKNNKVIKFTIPPSSEGADPDKYEMIIWIIKDNEENIINKLMLRVIGSDSDKGIYMTNGGAGLAQYRITEGTYVNSTGDRVEISTKKDVNENEYGTFDDGDKSIYVYKDGYIYVDWGEYKVISDTQFCNLIDDGTEGEEIFTNQ